MKQLNDVGTYKYYHPLFSLQWTIWPRTSSVRPVMSVMVISKQSLSIQVSLYLKQNQFNLISNSKINMFEYYTCMELTSIIISFKQFLLTSYILITNNEVLFWFQINIPFRHSRVDSKIIRFVWVISLARGKMASVPSKSNVKDK